METPMILAILSLVQEGIAMEPKIEAALRKIFSKPQPTPQDWQDERQNIAGQSYKDLVPDSKLP